MTKEFWLNLPVKNVEKTIEFFSKIGFSLNEKHTNSEMACFAVGEKNSTVLFFAEDKFKSFTKNKIPDPKTGSQVLISFDAESREEVDEMASKVFDAGGRICDEPAESQGWMYGFAFADLDGYRWNMLFMDSGKIPQK